MDDGEQLDDDDTEDETEPLRDLVRGKSNLERWYRA